APPAAQAGWQFGADRVVLRDGGLRFRDMTIKQSEPLDTGIDEIEVTNLAFSPTVYGGPSKAHVQIAYAGGSLSIDAGLEIAPTGMNVEVALDAERIPLQNSRLYIPRVGWSALQGEAAAKLSYRLKGTTQNELRGTISLQDVAVRVPDLEEPALAWKALTVKLDPLDLLAHRAAVADVQLAEATLVV